MDTLSLNCEHRGRIQNSAQFILDNLGQSQLVPLLDSLEALSDLGILSEGLEVLEQAEVLEPLFSSDALSDEVRELRVGLVDESSGSDTCLQVSVYCTCQKNTCAYHWLHS